MKDRCGRRAGVLVCLVGAGLVLSAPVRGVTTATDLCSLEADPCIVSTRILVTDGSIIDFEQRELIIAEGGRLDVGAGSMAISARAVTVEQRGELRANGSPQTIAGEISVAADEIMIAGEVVADGTNGGDITLTASGGLDVTGTVSANGTTGVGFGGDITITAAAGTIAGDVVALGASNGLGGCITVSARGDLLVGGTLRASGGDGGEITLVAGQGGAGNLQLMPATALNVNGTGGEGGSGGDIELAAEGNGDTTGAVTLAGGAQARGQGGGRGGDGGSITITAAGDIAGLAGSDTFDVNGGPPDGLAGEIAIVGGGSILLDNQLRAQGSGSEGAGGDISVRAAVDLDLGSNALVRVGGADDGGSIILSVEQGQMTVQSSVEASGTLAGDGGDITLEGFGDNASVFISGSVVANGGAASAEPGSGGLIDITAGDFVTVAGPPTILGGRVRAEGGDGGGDGGAIEIITRRGEIRLDGSVLAPGLGSDSAGGMLTVASGDALNVGGNLSTAGGQQGGVIDLSAAGVTVVGGSLSAAGGSSASIGGSIGIVSAADLTIGGSLVADGGDEAAAEAGRIDVTGCAVEVSGAALLQARGPAGESRIVGRELISIAGSVLTDASSGRNELVYRDPDSPPLISAGATIIPTPLQSVDTSLSSCAVCGDRTIEPPETCDDGNTQDGDGCSHDCQVEPAGLCDVNGDGQVNADDPRDLLIELFDGDGDRVGDVSGGTFPGQMGADANEDGRITAADLTFCLQVASAA